MFWNRGKKPEEKPEDLQLDEVLKASMMLDGYAVDEDIKWKCKRIPEKLETRNLYVLARNGADKHYERIMYKVAEVGKYGTGSGGRRYCLTAVNVLVDPNEPNVQVGRGVIALVGGRSAPGKTYSDLAECSLFYLGGWRDYGLGEMKPHYALEELGGILQKLNEAWAEKY